MTTSFKDYVFEFEAGLSDEELAVFNTFRAHYQAELAATSYSWWQSSEREATLQAELQRLREALELLGGIHSKTIGDWEFAARAGDREKAMRGFARLALAQSERKTS